LVMRPAGARAGECRRPERVTMVTARGEPRGQVVWRVAAVAGAAAGLAVVVGAAGKRACRGGLYDARRGEWRRRWAGWGGTMNGAECSDRHTDGQRATLRAVRAARGSVMGYCMVWARAGRESVMGWCVHMLDA